MASYCSCAALIHMSGAAPTPRIPMLQKFGQLKLNLNASFNMNVDPYKRIQEACVRLLDAFVDATFKFVDAPRLPSQSNFAPVEEIGEPMYIHTVEGAVPVDFPEGVYIRNGPNPLFGGLKTTKSIFGTSSHCWIEGEGMLHAMYFTRDADGEWKIYYNNKYVATDTFKLEKGRQKPAFLPAIEGDSAAVLLGYVLNGLRFGLSDKYLSNTSVFEHAGKFYSISENHIPQEIDIHTLGTLRNWDVNRAWKRPFTSHPKKAPGTGELVVMGIYPTRPYFEVGVVSADGQKLLHKADLKLERCSLCHEIGITERYNVIMDIPLTIDIRRLIMGGPLIKYDKEDYARIGIMPRYGDANSVKWFNVKTCCVFHIINCYEDGNEVVVLACRAVNSIIPGPDFGSNKLEWFSKGFEGINTHDGRTNEKSNDLSLLTRVYEWRLNMHNGDIAEKHLTGINYSMDFPMINDKYSAIKNRFGYTQVVNSSASSASGMAKYGGLAKLYFTERRVECWDYNASLEEDLIKVEYHEFPENTFCSGAAFVAKSGGIEEDDGWIITFLHDENCNSSQVYIIDAKNFSNKPLAKIALPCRVPYGFHGSFVPVRPQQQATR